MDQIKIRGNKYRDCVYCSCNDPSGTPIRPAEKRAIIVSHSSIRFVAGLMMPIPVQKYVQSGCMIQIDFLSFKSDHLHVTCYVIAANCLMIPHLVENRYIVQICDIEIRFLKYHNPAGCDKAVDVLRIEYSEPSENARRPLFVLAKTKHPQNYLDSMLCIRSVSQLATLICEETSQPKALRAQSLCVPTFCQLAAQVVRKSWRTICLGVRCSVSTIFSMKMANREALVFFIETCAPYSLRSTCEQ